VPGYGRYRPLWDITANLYRYLFRRGFAKLYTTKQPINSADLLNDQVIPFFEGKNIPLLRILTDRGTEYCGKVDSHDYQLFLALNDLDHTKTKVKNPQSNGICVQHLYVYLEPYSCPPITESGSYQKKP